MPVTPLLLPQAYRTKAFRGFVSFLRADQALTRVVKTWQVWSGDRNEDVPPEAQGNLPLVRITPMTAPAQRAVFDRPGGGTLLDSPITIKIETATAGTGWDDSSNLWGAIEARLMSQDPSQRPANEAALTSYGIMDLEVVQPGLGTYDPDNSLTTAVGMIKMYLFVPA